MIVGMFVIMRNNLRWCPSAAAGDAAGKFRCGHGRFRRDVRIMVGLVDSNNNNEKFESQYPRKRVPKRTAT